MNPIHGQVAANAEVVPAGAAVIHLPPDLLDMNGPSTTARPASAI
jgi:hypothetical protein